MGGVLLLQRWMPHMAARVVPPYVFALLLLAALCTAVVQSQAIYLRSFKREPFLVQSIFVATLTLLGALLTVRHLGAIGVAASYFLGTGILGTSYSSLVFFSWKGKRRGLHKLSRGGNCTIPQP